MGKLTSFAIQLGSPQVVYYPGQAVSGYLLVDLKEPMEMRRIRIKLTGKGACHWTEQRGSGKNRRTVHFRGNETLIAQESCLFGSASGSAKVKLPAGKQCFYFSFNLPTSLPSSFEGARGHIRYLLKGEIDKPWKFNHRVKTAVTVNDLIDPNLPMYKMVLGGEAHKDVGFWCCAAGPLDLSASTDRSAYCPGEAILITANVANQTTRDMDKLTAKLIQKVSYHATRKTRSWSKTIAKLDGPPVLRGENARWEHQPFGIPAIPPTIRNSKVVTVEYSVVVKVEVPWGFNPTITMNIVVGTIPFIPTYGQSFQYGTPQDQQVPPEANYIASPNYPPPTPGVLGYPDMPPPSYSAEVGTAEVNIAKDKDKHTYGEMKYTPVYTFAQPYQGSVPPYNPQFPASDPPPQYSDALSSTYKPPGPPPP